MLKKISDFSGGINKIENRSRIAPNEFDGKNLMPQEDGTLLKRPGRDLVSRIVTDEHKGSGLIQNETEEGVKELFAILVTDLYFKENGTWQSIFSGITDAPFYSEYWQNQGFWGNGIEDIISKRTTLINLRLYITEQWNHRISIFKKKIPNDFVKIFGEYGAGAEQVTSPRGIAVDSDKIYIADYANSRIQIFDKFGVNITDINTSGTCTDVDIDSQWIYVSNRGSTAAAIEVFDKTTYARDRILNLSTQVDGIAVDERYIYCTRSNTIYIYDKMTIAAVDSFVVGNIIRAIAVDREEMDTSYIYVSGYDTNMRIHNKASPYAEVGIISLTNVRGIIIDNQYIYLTYGNTVKIYDKSVPTPTLIATFSQTGNLGGDLNIPWGIATELIPTNDIRSFVSYLDAPARILALLDDDAGNITADTYLYRITFSDGTNETNASQESNSVVVAGTGKIWLQLLQDIIPDNITTWVIYRKKGAGDYHQLTTVAVSDTQYLDDIVEADILTKGSYPVKSTLYPFLDSRTFTFFRDSMWIIKGRYLYWSAPYQPYYFPADNYLQIDTKTDGSGIKGTESGLFVFTRNSFSILEGWSPDNYFYRSLSESVGCLTHRSIQEYLKMLIWLDRNGIFVSMGDNPEQIGTPHIDAIIASIQQDKIKYICSVIYEGKYFLALPTSAGNDYNDLIIVFDFELKCFYVIDGWKIQDFALAEDSDDNLLLYGISNDSSVYELMSGTGDDDKTDTVQDIECEIETKYFEEDMPTIKKLINNLIAITGNDGSNNVTITFKWKVDDNTEESRSVIVAKDKQINKVRPRSGRGKSFYFKITETGKYKFKIYGFETNMEVLAKSKIDKQGT